MRRLAVAGLLAAVVLLAAAVLWYHSWQHWLAHSTGSYDTPGTAHHYNFWSGAGSDLGELTLVVAVLTPAMVLYRKHNCHVHGCWRLGRHPVEGTPFVVCRRHHPGAPLTASDIHHRYHLYLGREPGRG